MRVIVSMVVSFAFCSAVLVAASSAGIFLTGEQCVPVAKVLLGE